MAHLAHPLQHRSRLATGLTGLVLAIGVGIGIGVGTAQLASADAGTTSDAPAPKTIVSITGSKADGFHVEHYDGTFLFPPTDSEAAAECGEYDTRIARVRCDVEVRTWYRDLGRTQAALDYAHAHP